MPNGGKRKMVLSLKMLQKILSLLLIASMATLVGCSRQEQKECCLCSSFRYHAPCLIDIETGDLKELELYFSHPTLVAELADPQPEQGTFSFVRLGNVSGFTDTANRIVEIDVPSADKTTNPALCQECLAQLSADYKSRYVLADLYDKDAKTLIPIKADTELTIRCYEISMQQNEDKDGIAVKIQGTLK